jgi:hypothetical protein
MRKHIKRISIGVLIGLAVFIGIVWLLSRTLGNHVAFYAGQPIDYWQQQLNSHDSGASNQAFALINTRIIPQLVDQMFYDTNDSKLRLSLIEALNGLPGVQINFTPADARRSYAAGYLGILGPSAKPAVPALIQVLKGKDAGVHEAAISALGKIRSNPDVVIPLLITFLDDENLNDEAATALGEFGPLAKGAVPKILPLLHARDSDARQAAREALKKIDPQSLPPKPPNN